MDSIAVRYAEIVFIRFIKDMLKRYSNPGRVLETVEVLAVLAKSEPIIVSSVARKIIAEQQGYTYTKDEFIYILSRANIDVAEMCLRLGISRTTFYRWKEKEKPSTPQFTTLETQAIVKLMRYIDDISGMLLPLKGLE